MLNVSPKYHLLNGSQAQLKQSIEAMGAIPIDELRRAPSGYSAPQFQSTITRQVSVTGPGTYAKGKSRTLTFLPAKAGTGWVFERTDHPGAPAIHAVIENVISSSRAVVLSAGMTDNCVRMCEHIVALRLGMGIDNLRIQLSSEDPPLFDNSSQPLVDALNSVGFRTQETHAVNYFTVKTPVAIMRPENGGFLIWEPAAPGQHGLAIDAAIDFPNAIGRQRIRIDLEPGNFAYGALARTNCAASEMRLAKWLGWLMPRYRNLGYTSNNILVADKDGYVNTPNLLDSTGKSLEAVWHRVCLDLVAALSLLPGCRPSGLIISYKAGHALDIQFLQQLLRQELLIKC